MIQRLYRFVKGFLVIEVTGRNVSRFLNLCTRNAIPVWEVECNRETQCVLKIYLQNFYDLRPLIRKTKVHLTIQKKSGLPFILHRYRARKVFAAVLLAMGFGIFLLAQRIWRIEVVGNSSIGEETIIEYLQTKNISYGVKADSIDNDALELSLRQDFDEIIWANVYEEGTKLVVSFQEKIAMEEVAASADICMDLVADKDGEIASIITRSGLAAVKEGDSVKKGDIIVCGRQEILDDSGEVREYYYQSADADVMIYTSYDYEDWIPVRQISSQQTGEEHTRFFLRILDYQFTSPKLYADYDNFEMLEDARQLCLMQSFYLPVYYGNIREIELEKYVLELSMEEAKERALVNFQQFLSDLEENGVIIQDKNVMIEKMGENYHIYGTVDVCEKITAKAPTEILENPVVEEDTQEE